MVSHISEQAETEEVRMYRVGGGQHVLESPKWYSLQQVSRFSFYHLTNGSGRQFWQEQISGESSFAPELTC